MTAAATFEDRPLAASVHAAQRTGAAVGYMPQIDALRAFSVSAVLLGHYLYTDYWISRNIPWGGIGVRLFFTISGFLITGILLNCRSQVERQRTDRAGVTKRFYIRRFLRIFPVFYVMILMAAVLNVTNVRSSLIWHVSYLSNFWVARHGWVMPISHLWSLAVEEQFYLIWPTFILLVPRKWLVHACVGLICFAVVYRLIVTKMGGWLWADVMMPGCLDTLGAGALLAVLRADVMRYQPARVTSLVRWSVRIGLPLSVVIWVAGLFGISLRGMTGIVSDTVWALVFVWLVDRCATGVTGRVGKFLQWRSILYIGRISYGIYIIHQFTPGMMEWIFGKMNFAYPSDRLIDLIIQTPVTILLASLSWFVLEKPLNDLKRYFPYNQARRVRN